MDPKAALIAYMQQMQGGQTAPGLTPQAQSADPMQPGMPLEDELGEGPEHELAESPEFEAGETEDEGEAYSHADMIAHHDSISGLIQVLVNMTNSAKGAPKLGVPSQIEKNSAAYKGY